MRKINEKKKNKKGCGCFLILLILSGFAISVYLFKIGALSEIIHP